MPARGRFAIRVLVLLGAAALPLTGASAGVQAAAGEQHAQVSPAAHHDTSAPLRDMSNTHTPGVAHPARHLPAHGGQSDTKGQAVGSHGSYSTTQIPSASTNWEGVGDGFSGPQGTFTPNAAPPDTDGAVGPNHYVQIVNESFAVFDKTGTVLYGPVSSNTLFSGFGGLCQTDNDGDATVVYDRAADRWVISQFAVSGANGKGTPYLQCVAVSATGDPTGSYHRYSFTYTDFPDYPKLGVWPDAYYTTFNMFSGNLFVGAKVAAYDRTAMLNGLAATQQTFSPSTSYGSLLPANVDSSTLPAAGTPEWLVAQGASGASSLAYWQLHVDWTTPANSTFSGASTLATETWNPLCSGGTCVPQAGTNQQLDSLADRIMYMVGYRNFGDHEALVVSQSVAPSAGGGGIAWFELRPSGGALTIYQQGVYAPDTNYRWMPSIAMDRSGDVGIGFSLSGSSLHPAIHYTGRLAGDPLGSMSQGEGTIINGGGSQSGSGLNRWGDYSQISVDPSDDCTFWYTSEYEAVTGAFNWHTRIGSFKFAGCGTTASNDFSITASPTTQTVAPGGSTTYTVTTAVTSGSAQTVNLSASGLPSGAAASFNPTSVTTAGGSSVMTVSTGTTTPAGSYRLTVTGTAPSATHSTTVNLTVSGPPDFTISATPSSASVAAGSPASYTVTVGSTNGFSGAVSLSASGTLAGDTYSFSPSSVTPPVNGSSTSTLTVKTSNTGGDTITITGASGSTSHNTTVTLTVTAPCTPDFSVSATPASNTVKHGQSVSYSVTMTPSCGFAGPVTWSSSGCPPGATCLFSPASGTTSTLTVSTSGSTPNGGYTITITGTSGSLVHSTTVTLSVTGKR